MKEFREKPLVRQVMLDGILTVSQLENGLHAADFSCIEDVHLEPFVGRCKVQAMRDGNLYITQQPPRKRNKPLYREDNCSLSLGADGRYYFSFSLTQTDVEKLPHELVRQASAIARKVMMDIIGQY